MLVDETKCIGCGKCIPYCPVQARSFGRAANGGRTYVVIDRELCVECAVCERANVCPVDAIHQEELLFPRNLRSVLSNPLVPCVGTGVPGRGTEEIKTNEVTGRVKFGRAGVGIEMGRPGISTKWSEVEKVCMAVARLDIGFCVENPVTTFMTDTTTGKLQPEVLDVRSLSAIVEFEMAADDLPALFKLLREEVNDSIDTVYTFEIAERLYPDGRAPVKEVIRAHYDLLPVSKSNLGLGRPRFEEVAQ